MTEKATQVAGSESDLSVEAGGTRPTTDDVPQKHDGNIVLVPQPSDDPRDPLNWSQAKKWTNFVVLCYATFCGLSSGTSLTLALVASAETFNTTPTYTSYLVSACIGGIMVGSLLIVPIEKMVGVTSCCFWSHVALTAVGIWSAEASGPNDYGSQMAARTILGLFCPTTQVVTNGVIVNMFFLHQRGRAFAIHATVYTTATMFGPIFSGFIVSHQQWPAVVWWTVGSNALAAILILLFVDDTSWDREAGKPASRRPIPAFWLPRKATLLFPGHKAVPSVTAHEVLKSAIMPYIIFIQPVSLLAGFYTVINFGWFVISTIELPILMEEPYEPAAGVLGYGFTPQQTAAWFFAWVFGALCAVAYGVALNDRVPLNLSRKQGGAWHPEYRLYTSWFPGLICAPIACGLFGAAAYYHLHYMVSALGAFINGFAGIASVPISINYVIESFKEYPQEGGAAQTAYRLGFGLALPFFYPAWAAAVGVNWLWGMAAFFSILAFGPIALLIWKGQTLRKYTFLLKASAEDKGEAEMTDKAVGDDVAELKA